MCKVVVVVYVLLLFGLVICVLLSDKVVLLMSFDDRYKRFSAYYVWVNVGLSVMVWDKVVIFCLVCIVFEIMVGLLIVVVVN